MHAGNTEDVCRHCMMGGSRLERGSVTERTGRGRRVSGGPGQYNKFGTLIGSGSRIGRGSKVLGQWTDGQ